MLKLEFMKLKRSYLFLILTLTIILNMIIQFYWGNMTYLGTPYNNRLGWVFDSALSLSTYYLFAPVFALLGSNMIEKEERYGTLNYLKVIPLQPIKILWVKFEATFIIAIGYSFLMFVGIALLEIVPHHNSITVSFLLTYMFRFVIHGIGSFLTVCPIIALSLLLKKGNGVSVILSFIIAFCGVLTASSTIAPFYPINAIFFISGMYNGKASQFITALFSLAICFLLSILICLSIHSACCAE